jgi:hypothetical protein
LSRSFASLKLNTNTATLSLLLAIIAVIRGLGRSNFTLTLQLQSLQFLQSLGLRPRLLTNLLIALLALEANELQEQDLGGDFVAVVGDDDVVLRRVFQESSNVVAPLGVALDLTFAAAGVFGGEDLAHLEN